MPPKRPEFEEEARRRMKRGLIPEAVAARERMLAGEPDEEEEAEGVDAEEEGTRSSVEDELDTLAALAAGKPAGGEPEQPRKPISLTVGGSDGADTATS